MNHVYTYQIADITIRITTELDIHDSYAMSLYRIQEKDSSEYVYDITLIEDQNTPVYDNNLVLFQDELNTVYEHNHVLLHVFHRPFIQGIDAWHILNNQNYCELHYTDQAKEYFSDSTGILNAVGMERILYAYHKYLFHCAYVSYKDYGVLFTANSGGGKTTQGKLWETYTESKMINGDRAVLDIKDDTYWCHGLPIAGSSGVFINESYPVSCIFCVNKANENQVIRLSMMDAFQRIYEQMTVNTWNDAFKLDTIDFVMNQVTKIPVYQLDCRIDEEAVEVAKEVVEQIIYKNN